MRKAKRGGQRPSNIQLPMDSLLLGMSTITTNSADGIVAAKAGQAKDCYGAVIGRRLLVVDGAGTPTYYSSI